MTRLPFSFMVHQPKETLFLSCCQCIYTHVVTSFCLDFNCHYPRLVLHIPQPILFRGSSLEGGFFFLFHSKVMSGVYYQAGYGLAS